MYAYWVKTLATFNNSKSTTSLMPPLTLAMSTWFYSKTVHASIANTITPVPCQLHHLQSSMSLAPPLVPLPRKKFATVVPSMPSPRWWPIACLRWWTPLWGSVPNISYKSHHCNPWHAWCQYTSPNWCPMTSVSLTVSSHIKKQFYFLPSLE